MSAMRVFSDDSSRELALLTDWKLEDGHLNLRNSLRALYLATLCGGTRSGLFWKNMIRIRRFSTCCRGSLQICPRRPIEESFLAFELDLLREAGFMPELVICVKLRDARLGIGTAFISLRRAAGSFAEIASGDFRSGWVWMSGFCGFCG